MDSQKFCLKWNNYQNSVTSVFENLRQDEELVDITLCCEGHKIKAHRMMLSACSPYFRDLLKENPCQHPVFFLKDTSYPDLAAVVEFVYKGEVNVAQSQLGSFLKTAEMLQVRGLTGDDDEEVAPQTQQQSSKPSTPRGPGRPPVSSAPAPHLNSGLSGRPRPASPPLKRQRLSISPDRTGAAPASSAPAAPAPAPAASLPAALPPPPPPMPPLSLPMSSTVPAPLPPATSSMVTAHSDLTSRAATAAAPDRTGAGAEPPMSPATEEPRTPQQQTAPAGLQQRDYGIKVEKVDLADEDDESLEATFSHVSNFEASQFEGSDHSAGSHDMSGLLGRVSDQGMGDMSAMAGPSEDGIAQGCRFRCAACPQSFLSRAGLSRHKAVHRGETGCLVCGRVFSNKYNLSVHMTAKHRPPTVAGDALPPPPPPAWPPGLGGGGGGDGGGVGGGLT